MVKTFDTIDNKCHTLSRYSCYKYSGRQFDQIKNYSFDSIVKHKFYDAPTCALNIFGGLSTNSFLSSTNENNFENEGKLKYLK